MHRTWFAAALALVVAACSGEADPERMDPGRLVLWNGEAIGMLADSKMSDIEATGSVSQVTPGPDDTLAWTQIESNPPSVKAVIAGETRVPLETPTVAFFYQWSPTGDHVALLGNAPSGGELLFGLIDVEAVELTTVQRPPPLFFDWSPDGTHVIAHVGGSVLSIVDAATGEVRDLPDTSGAFPTPIWVDRGIVVATRLGPTVSTLDTPVGLRTASSEVVLIDPDDGSRTTLAQVNEPVRLFSSDAGLALVVGVEGSQRIDVVDWDGTSIATLGEGTIDLAQWSPDGSMLLWTERDGAGSLKPMTWAGGETSEYEAFRPSSVFASAYLPFWDQYDRAISMWAGDSTTFSVPTDEGVVVHGIDGTSSTYPGWDMGAWTVGTADG